MQVTKHAEEKVRTIRTVVGAADLNKLQNEINSQYFAGKGTFNVVSPLSKPVLDQFHGNWEYRNAMKAVVRDNTLITVYFVQA